MQHFLPPEVSTSLTIINTALCSLTGWELSLGKRQGGEWVYILRCHENHKTFIVGKVVRV